MRGGPKGVGGWRLYQWNGDRWVLLYYDCRLTGLLTLRHYIKARGICTCLCFMPSRFN